MKKFMSGAFGLLCASGICFFPGAGKAFSLSCVPRQGDLVYGTLFPGERLFLNEEEIKSSPDGRFVFALPYDAPEEARFVVRLKKREISVFVPVEKRQWKKEEVSNLPREKVSYSDEVKERIEKENLAVRRARAESTEDFFPVCFSMPVTGRISSEFASMRTLNGQVTQMHSGTDIAAKEGTPIEAPADGIVKFTGKDFFLTGNTVLLDHGYGVFSSYSHLSEIGVQEGQLLKKGEVLGKVGVTGRVTGPHLHWVVLWKEKRVDPLSVVETSSALCLEE